MKQGSVKQHWIITIIVAVIVGAIGFGGGVIYQKGQQPVRRAGQLLRGTSGSQGMQQRNFQPVAGTITAMDASSITVSTQNGSSKIIVISASTTVTKATTAAISDLKTGDKITVIGTTGSDGTVTAESISLGNMGMPGGQPPQGNQPPEDNQTNK
jgi:hypothetical protein